MRTATAPSPSTRRRRTRQSERLLPSWLSRTVIALGIITVAVPVAYLLVLSVSSEVDVQLGNIVPKHFDFGNYVAVWRAVPLLRGFVNSAIICGAAALLAVLVATAAAYPLARYRFHGGRSILYSAVVLQLVPGPMLLLPIYAIFAAVQVALGVTVIGSYEGIVITYLTFSLPFALWLMVSYLRSVPRELEEAAWVDGASAVYALRKVVLPIALPGMVVTFVFSLLLGWNDVLFASVLTSASSHTLAVELQLFTVSLEGTAVPQYALLMAAGVLAAAPVVIAYLLLQRYLVNGLAAGAVK